MVFLKSHLMWDIWPVRLFPTSFVSEHVCPPVRNLRRLTESSSSLTPHQSQGENPPMQKAASPLGESSQNLVLLIYWLLLSALKTDWGSTADGWGVLQPLRSSSWKIIDSATEMPFVSNLFFLEKKNAASLLMIRDFQLYKKLQRERHTVNSFDQTHCQKQLLWVLAKNILELEWGTEFSLSSFNICPYLISPAYWDRIWKEDIIRNST